MRHRDCYSELRAEIIAARGEAAAWRKIAARLEDDCDRMRREIAEYEKQHLRHRPTWQTT